MYRLLILCCHQKLPRRPLSRRSIPSIADPNSEIIYYDLETTGLNPVHKHHGVEILQLGAISSSQGSKFHQYILPTKPINYFATKVHGLYLKKEEGELDFSSLYTRGEDGVSRKVDAVDKVTGLKRFSSWLDGFEGGVLLTGYNSHNYDDWVLCHQLQGVIGGNEAGIKGLADVSKIVRPVLRKQLGTRKWNLGFAVENLLKRSQSEAHRALSDAEDVRDLLVEIAKMRNETVRKVLDESGNAVRDFEGVWTVCFNMLGDNEKANDGPVRYRPRIFEGFLKTEKDKVQNG